MPIADVDPVELKKFAQMLQLFNQDLEQNTRMLQGQFKNLGETWKDQKYTKFAQEFEQLIGVLRKFTQSSEEHIPLLREKARIVEEYLKTR